MKKVAFAVVGVRNFAQNHIRNIQAVEEEGIGELRAVVVRDQERYSGNLQNFLAELQSQGVVIYSSYEELLEKGKGIIDIITLPVAMHTHYELAKQGMEAGYNLVLEKPPVPTVQQLDELMAVEKQTGTFCSIGFQMIHSRSLRRLKQEILAGKLGKIKEILRLKTCI